MFLLERLLNPMVQHTDRRFYTFHKNHENYQKRQPCYDTMSHGACLLEKVYKNWQSRFWEPCIWQLWRLRKRLSRCRSTAYKRSYSGPGKLQVFDVQFKGGAILGIHQHGVGCLMDFWECLEFDPHYLVWEVLLANTYPSRWYISISGAGGQTGCWK